MIPSEVSQTKKEKARFLRGNFETKRQVIGEAIEESLTDRFEREALKRLGGSMAFVSKKKFLYSKDKRDTEQKAR